MNDKVNKMMDFLMNMEKFSSLDKIYITIVIYYIV